MKKLIALTAISAVALGAAARPPKMTPPLKYPEAPQEVVVDNYFGIKLADPFRPLENDTSRVTLDWVEAENAVTRAYLDAIPYRDQIRERLAQFFDYTRTGNPWRDNDGKYYVYENDGLRNQSVVYRMNKPGGKKTVFLDPNKLSDDGTVALKGLFQSWSGRWTAYTISRNGSDWTEIYVMDTKTGKLTKDHIVWAKFTGASWHGDDGFFYSAYPVPEEGKEFSNANEGHRVMYHKLGTPQSEDVLVYEDPAHPFHFHSAYVPDGEEMVIIVESGEDVGEALYVKRLDREGDTFRAIEPTQKYVNDVIDAKDGKIYIVTNREAPRKRLMVADVDNPSPENWKEIVGEQEGVLDNAQLAGDRIVLTYSKDANNHVVVTDLDGNQVSTIELPGLGTVNINASKKDNDEVFFAFTSFTAPWTVYRHSLKTGRSELLYRPELKGFNPDDYVTEQVFVTSKDGTKVPLYLTYKKGIELNGQNPAYLYGYGGFNVALPPSFSAQRLFWLENGGIYAQANLRGGSEYGEEWHQAGTKQNKLNVFDDFIACGEWLIDNGYTTEDLLAIEGGSNGGLLVGATVNLRPDLMRVAIPRVGVMDMMRYHLFTIGWNWASDYGRSDDSPEMAKYLLGYSPMHNIRNDGTPYPAILVTTADHDDRVVPAHSFKYAATLQEANTGDAPKLIRIDSNAGHGAGKPMSKVLDEYADMYAFIFKNMDLVPVQK